MNPSVAAIWWNFNTPFEGRTNFMYLDKLGLVTTGVGNLVDPVVLALALPWKRPDGTRATDEEIVEAWETVRGKTGWRHRGGVIYGSLTTIRLDWDDVRALVASKLRDNERALRRRFPAFPDWPADAQLATHSMAWAMGEPKLSRFPKFCAAALQQDFATCADECVMNSKTQSGTLVDRNIANVRLFSSAAQVLACGGDRAELHWPLTSV